MKRTCIVWALGLVICAGAWGAEEGLVASWNFDEGEGNILHDRSGNGNDGVITGGATWVKGQRGSALSFDGKSGMVEIKKSASLNLAGDMTLLAWVKTVSDYARDRIIFGDGAGAAVHRNLCVEVDRGSLYIEHSNDVGAGQTCTVTPDIRFDGTWTHLAIIYEFPQYYIYINGVLVNRGPITIPLAPTQGGNRYIGGWYAGKFKGEIDEMKLYNRALPEREVLSHFQGRPVAPKPAARVTPRFKFLRKRMSVHLLCWNIAQTDAVAEVTIHRQGQKRPVRTGSVALEFTRPDSERGVAQILFDTEGFTAGPYEIRAAVRDRQGKTLVTASADLAYPERPSWLGSKKGISDEVLPPYTPVIVKHWNGARGEQRTGGLSVGTWGRDYAFDGRFIAGITSKNAAILAAPARIVARVDGKEPSWRPLRVEPGGRSPAEVVINQGCVGGGVSLLLQTTVEYDGFAKVSLQLKAQEPVTLQKLELEVPYNTANARYLHTWRWERTQSGARSGAIKGDYASAFRPIVWIGDDERGLSWFWESDEGWCPSSPDKAIEVVRADEYTTLRFNIVGKPVKLTPGNDLHYTFAFQATPLKPIEKDGWDFRFISSPWYGDDYGLLTRKVEGKPALQYLRDKGCRVLIVFNWTNIITYPWPIGREKEFKELVTACHRYDIKVIPYIGYQICDDAPEYAFLGDDVIRVPREANPDSYPGKKARMVNAVCMKSVWQDCLVDHVARMIDEYDIDGVYLDSTNMPFHCKNELHGCGYRRADGTLGWTYPVFAIRQTFKRLYTVVKQKKPDGIVDAHVYDCMNSAALAFATSYWNGEQLRRDPTLSKELPLDRFRAEMMGVNWGVPADFLWYRLCDFKKAHAVALLHDTPVRAGGAGDLDLTSSVWKLADDFDRKGARFLPYWNNSEYVQIEPPDCYVSLYQHPKNGVLAVVSNLGREPAWANVQLDPARLGLEGMLIAHDALTNAQVDTIDGLIRLLLPSLSWKVIWVRSGTAIRQRG